MSIIIRLQNLPVSAKSGDVRSFFGGLHIPNGGVHILGGEKGDAFIAFNSSEVARLAMKKDGEKIKDSRIKLFLSSHVEMKYEVEKLTKSSFVDTSTQKVFRSPERIREDENTRHKVSEKTDRRRFSRSRSPHRYDDRDDKFRNHYHERSRSPKDTEEVSSRYRSSSWRRSISSSPHRSQSPKSRSFFERQRPVSPKLQSYSSQSRDDVPDADWLKSNYCNNSGIDPARQSEIQAELERRITEALEMNPLIFNAISICKSQENVVAASDVSTVEQRPFSQEFDASFPVRNVPGNFMQNDFFSSSLPPFKPEMLQFQNPEFKEMLDRNLQNIQSPVSHLEMLEPRELQQQKSNFFITVSGMHPAWDLRKIQLMMNDIYAPPNCIAWERDNSGCKTGTAFVKLFSKEDFECMINKATFIFEGHRITVSECPSFLIPKYFPEELSFQNIQNMPQSCNFCYKLKGLPFSCKYDDIVSFFHGFDIADIVILYDKLQRASGIGFVSFTNWKDFEGAKACSGKKIGHRYVELLPCSERDMIEAKKMNQLPPGFGSASSGTFQRQRPPSSRRPICVLLTGLPSFTRKNRLRKFFSESGLKPDAIHITLNSKRHCDGRAFVEFTNLRDFDLAIKLHGSNFCDNIICVKQILYDEMSKILDSQKATHFFEVHEPSESPSDVPEKVPYLWEPPDAAEEHGKFVADNINIQLGNHTHGPASSYKNHAFNYANKRESQALDFFRNAEKKDNVTKLAPVKALHALESFQDNASAIKMKNENFKDRQSPEERGRHSYVERGLEREKRQSREEKHKYTSKNITLDSRSRNEKDSRWSNNGRVDSHHRSPVWSDLVYSEKDERLPEDKRQETRECTVQISNVNQFVGTQDVVEFLHGFHFFQDSIVRRYTNEGEPTSDVRVTFTDRREAEMAVRTLNRCHLGDMRVSMFIA